MEKLISETLDNIKTPVGYSLEKELKLKSWIITYLIMTRTKENVSDLTYELITMLNDDDNFRMNNNPYLEIVLSYALRVCTKEEIINNFVINGYLFHSFNGAFYNSIKERGLILKNKPWDLEELEKVKTIFSTHGRKHIFGLYQGEEKTPIYFASNLESSSYYAISSPTWFLHFVSGNIHDEKYDKEAYRNRDYDGCLRNILNLCAEYKLTEEERIYVLRFFDKYYEILGLNKTPKVLLIERSKLDPVEDVIPKDTEVEDLTYLKEVIRYHSSKNIMAKNNINKEDIFIIDYVKERKYEI